MTNSITTVCDHVFVHLETIKKTDTTGTYQIGWKRTDRFFCQKCLEQRETYKSEWSRDKPEWY